MAGVRDRPTSEVLILLVTLTVCLAVLGFGVLLSVLAIRDPGLNLEAGFRAVTGILNTLLGLTAGYLAGRARNGAK